MITQNYRPLSCDLWGLFHFMELSNFNSEKKFSSLYLVEQINIFRKQEEGRAILRHSDFLAKIENEFSDEITERKISPVDYLDKKRESRKMYELNFEQSVQILMSESKAVRKRVVEVLKKQQAEIIALQAPKELSRKELALMVVQVEEEKEQLQLRVENLNTALDSLVEWVSIIKVSTVNKVKESIFDWRKLKKTSESLGYEIKKAQSPRFGYQNLYHVNAFKICYPQFIYNF